MSKTIVSHDSRGTYLATCEQCDYYSQLGGYLATCHLGRKHAMSKRSHEVSIIHLSTLTVSDTLLYDPPQLDVDPPF